MPLCKTVQKAHSRIHNRDTICSDLLPPSPKPVSDATVGSLIQDIALMKLYVSAAPAVVCGGTIYSTLNLITFHEF